MMPKRLAWSLSRPGESAGKADRLGYSLSQALKDTLGSQGTRPRHVHVLRAHGTHGSSRT